MADFWSERSVLLTGATGGIGTALAQGLAGRARRLILLGRAEQALASLAASLHAECWSGDLANPSQRSAAIARFADWEVDVLINCAGIGGFGPMQPGDAERDRALIELNVVAATELTRAVLPHMRSRGLGHIVNIASNAGLLICPFMSVYAATKAYLIHLGECLRAELHGTGVRVHTICPGSTRTRFFASAGLMDGDLPPKMFQSPEAVAAETLRAVERGRAQWVCGRTNRWLDRLSRTVPRALHSAVARRLLRRLAER